MEIKKIKIQIKNIFKIIKLKIKIKTKIKMYILILKNGILIDLI
jgi:hypothetical protein